MFFSFFFSLTVFLLYGEILFYVLREDAQFLSSTIIHLQVNKVLTELNNEHC